MLCHTKENDKYNAELISKRFDFEIIEYDITRIYENLKSTLNFLSSFT